MIARGCAGHRGMTLPIWCRVCIWIVYRSPIRRSFIVPIVYRDLESFLSGVVQEGWALARSMLAGSKWVRAESDSAANQIRRQTTRLADYMMGGTEYMYRRLQFYLNLAGFVNMMQNPFSGGGII